MADPRILLGPGASGTIERLRPHQQGLAARGCDVRLVELPRASVERALPVYRAALEEVAGPVIIGGHSFGGRVASLLAAERPPAALVLLSYPLHAPGRQSTWEDRTAHWPAIGCPVLLLSGESDPFAEIGLLRTAAERLADASIVTYPRVGHGLGPVLDDALDRIAAFAKEHT
jgi:predicted alpha/beta-hydrolase family hydrolase